VRREVVVEGVGLHTGGRARVTLAASDGPVRIAVGRLHARVEELEVVGTARATTVAAHGGALRVGTVEHAMAALAGMDVYQGVTLVVEGAELPLLDGGAAAWFDALADVRPPTSLPRLRVARAAVFEVGPSRYEMEPADGVHVEARLELDDERLEPEARWLGDARDFRARIAPARTFALARELEELVRRGLARHVDPACVVVVAPDAVHASGAPFSADEPARHKLLDLLGDLYLAGGPPIGRVRAVRPGHAANARAVRRALEDGVLV
jgi:UDP-3-O-[3-hydroxymyristoyl] N-acetylglucosamine deacetylase